MKEVFVRWFETEDGVTVETGNGVPKHVENPMSKKLSRELITEQSRIEAAKALERADRAHGHPNGTQG